jgi:hypothetical protein
MEVICSSETSLGFRLTALRYIPEDRTLQSFCVYIVKALKFRNFRGTIEMNFLLLERFISVSFVGGHEQQGSVFSFSLPRLYCKY